MSATGFHEYKEHAGGCPYCGNSPVNHRETYVEQTLAVFTSRVTNRSGSFHFLQRTVGGLADILEALFYRILGRMPFSSFAHDPNAAVTYRSQVVWEEAIRRGIPMEQLAVLGKLTDIYRADLGSGWFYFRSLPISPFLKMKDAWVDDKLELLRVLKDAGVSVPEVHSAISFSDAAAVFPEMDGAVIVKPRSGSRGRHTTVNVQTLEQLRVAFRRGQQLCRYVLIESYLDGPVCRATVVGGKLVGFFRADPPRITGDGHSTIAQLIAAQNESKPDRVGDIVLSPEHHEFIARLGLTSESMLPKGMTISLTHRTGRLFGGHTREMLGEEHPKLRAAVERAAAALPVPIVGFDVIVPHPEEDPDTQRWGIIEGNTLPYIDLHYLPLTGRPSNPAAAVWDFVQEHVSAMHTKGSTPPGDALPFSS